MDRIRKISFFFRKNKGTSAFEWILRNLHHRSQNADVHKQWLTFMATILFFFVTVSSISHEDILLENRIKLPIVLIDVPFKIYILFSPILIVLVHVYLASSIIAAETNSPKPGFAPRQEFDEIQQQIVWKYGCDRYQLGTLQLEGKILSSGERVKQYSYYFLL